jgi:uncharacterized phage-associated protein
MERTPLQQGSVLAKTLFESLGWAGTWMFSPTRIAQMAAFFAAKEPRSTINIMKLIKLMYLSDRESLARYGDPITFDNMFSLDEGPILSRSLNMINGVLSIASAEAWDKWMSGRDQDHNVVVHRDFTRDDLDYLSDADLAVLQDVWGQFGHMDQWQLSDYTHEHCPEWQNPNGSRLPIDEAELLKHLGRTKEDAAEIKQGIENSRSLDRILARR